MNLRKQITYLAAVGVLIVIFGTIYAVVQQAQRNDANSPQIQMSEDMAAQIDSAKDPHLASTLSPVNMGTSLAPFTIIYDKKGNVVSGSGYLDNKVPQAPADMLQKSSGKTYNAVTWEPADNVRIASVTVSSKSGYYVLSGRSLTEVEKNENHTLLLAVIGGILALLVVVAAIVARTFASEPVRH